MSKKPWKWILVKAVVPAVSVVMLSGVSYATWTAYQAGGGFNPQLSSSRAIQDNQVIFPGQEKVGNNKEDGADSGDSSMWEKNQDAQESIKPDVSPDAPQLFQDSVAVENPQDAGQLVSEVTDPQILAQLEEQGKKQQEDGIQNPMGMAGSTILTPGTNGDKNLIVPGGVGGTAGSHGGTGSGSGDGASGSGSSGSDHDGGSGGSGSTGGGSGTGGGAGGETGGTTDPDVPKDPTTPTDPTTPVNPDQPVNDPDPEPELPQNPVPGMGQPSFPDTGVDTDGSSDTIEFTVIDNNPQEDMGFNQAQFYCGEPLDSWKLLCAVYATVKINGSEYRLNRYSNNFKVGEFPNVAEGNFKVTFSFRPNENTQRWIDREVTIYVFDNKTVIADQSGKTVNAYWKNLEDQINLSENDSYIFSTPPAHSVMTEILTGWSEEQNGASLPNSYPITEKGRHVIYALPLVPVPAEMTVRWEYSAELKQYGATLTAYNAANQDLLIPEGMKAIRLTTGSRQFSINRMVIPSSVASIEMNSYLNVTDEFVVAEGNGWYCNDVSGLLYDKNQTVLQAVPESIEEVTLPDTVVSIDNNAFVLCDEKTKIHLTSAVPPSFRGKDVLVSFYVPAEDLLAYQSNWDSKYTIYAEDGTTPSTIVKDGAVLSADGTILYGITSQIDGVFIVPESVTTLADGALNQSEKLSMIILPEGLTKIGSNQLPEGSALQILSQSTNPFAVCQDSFGNASYPEVFVPNGSIDLYRNAWEAELSGEFLADHVHGTGKKLLESRGCSYLVDMESGDDKKEAVLVKVPLNLTSFDETMIPETISLKRIEEKVFQKHDALIRVILPESVTEIGTSAFEYCKKLQGIYSSATDPITVGNLAFDHCEQLRFVAFSAMEAYFEEDYIPDVSLQDSVHGLWCNQLCHAPYQSVGYPESSFASLYFYYELEDTDQVDQTKLYGVTEYVTETGEPVARTLISSFTGIEGEVRLKENTDEIASGAFFDCNQSFWIPDEDMQGIVAVQENALACSAFCGNESGELTLSENLLYVDRAAFAYTKVKKVKVDMNNDFLDSGTSQIALELFAGCTSLDSVEFGEDSNITAIGEFAFTETGLTSFTIPKTVTEIHSYVFSYCDKLEELVVTSALAPTLVPMSGLKFQFMADDQLPERIVCSFDEVSDDEKEEFQRAYVDSWKYPLSGGADWDDLFWNLLFQSFDFDFVNVIYEENALVLNTEYELCDWFEIEHIEYPDGLLPEAREALIMWNDEEFMLMSEELASDSNWGTASDSDWCIASGSNWETASGSDWGSDGSSGWNLEAFLAWLTEPASDLIYDENGYLGDRDIYGETWDEADVELPERPVASRPSEDVIAKITTEEPTDTGEQEEEKA